MTVVAGVDESPLSRTVVARALEEARWRDTDLHVVYVDYLPPVYTNVAVEWGEVAKAQRATVWGGLEDVLAESDVTVERVNLEGYPPDLLVDYADEVKATLLVVGTRGRGEFASLILGSTSHRAIHLARSDVLVVKAPADQDSPADQ
ncbi:MAG TPA: universal stress protein [Acidimicrobiia bacterium]|nr:universal stress protein [Acidimicrobiia bacterium]